MSLTVAQENAVKARGKTIVSAAAGSGKTHVMVTRFAELVRKEHVEVRSMLAVTFTNKAADQMRDRIRKALLEGVASAEGEEREFLSRQLRELPLADICTIDAYCGRLLRTYFYLAGIDPAFRIVGSEDAEGLALSGRAMDRVLEDAYEGKLESFEDLLAVFFRKKDTGIRELAIRVYNAVRTSVEYREILSKIAAGEEDLFEEAVKEVHGEYARRVQRLLDELREAGKALPVLSGRLPQESYDKIAAYYTELEGHLLDVLGAGDFFDLCGRIAVPPKKSLSDKNISDPLALETIAALKHIRTDLLGKMRSRELSKFHPRAEERMRYESSVKQVRALAALTLAYDDAYTDIKREAGVLDYGDLEHLAIGLLQHEEVRSATAQKYRYIFVDEYQDVNPMQETIVSLLSGKDVFLVGDLKQAIYAFRGSKSDFFREKEAELAKTGSRLALSDNFRSAQAVLDAVNAVFSVALDGYETLCGGALYGEHRGEVFIHDLPKEEKEDGEDVRGVYSVRAAAAAVKTDATAERVAAIVEEECGLRPGTGREVFDTEPKDPDDPSKGQIGMRKVVYGDIAVLVRKNKDTASAVVRALSDRGIPVTAQAKINICSHFEVRLLLDWLSFLDDPEQDIPMASAMLSVAGGFSDDDLAAIRLFADGQGMRGNFREACRLYASCHGAGDAIADKLTAFDGCVRELRDLMWVRSASEMLVLLLAKGLEAQIAAKGESAVRLARVRRLIAESANAGDVHSFLAQLRDCGYEVELSEAGGENAVRVVTMHSAKGLEFPVVIVIDLDDGINGLDLTKDLLWTDKYHIVLRGYDLEKKTYCDTLMRKASDIYARKEAIAGELNLLYVAMTRAQYRLHLVFKGGPSPYATAEEELAHYSVADAAHLSDFIPRLSLDAVHEDISPMTLPGRADGDVLYAPDPQEAEKIRFAMRPYAHPESTAVPVKDSATGLLGRDRAPMYRDTETEEEDTMSETDIEDAGMGGSPEVGTAYHAFLEHVVFGEDVKSELKRMEREKLLSPEQIALLDEKKLEAILQMPHLRTLKGKKTYREQRFLARFPASEFASAYGVTADDEVLYQGAIDLLVDEGDGEYTVIDYKFSGKDGDALLAHYAVQLKLYRMTAARVMKTDLSHVKVFLVNIARGYEVACP